MFSCAFVLSLISALPALPVSGSQHIDTSFTLLDDLISRGNIVASYRKDELEQLLSFLKLLDMNLAAREPALIASDSAYTNDEQGAHDASRFPHLPQSLGVEGPLQNVNGLSPDHMLTIAGLLDWSALGDGTLPDSWLWADTSDGHNDWIS